MPPPNKLCSRTCTAPWRPAGSTARRNTWSNIYTKRFFEVQDGITETNHSYLGYVVFIGTGFWRGLSGEDRTELQEIFNEVSAARNRLASKLNDESRQKIIDAGGVVRVLSDMQRAMWEDAMRPVWKQYEDQIGADLLRAAQSADPGVAAGR